MVHAGGYDIIGDIHGYADKLEGLLKMLGYKEHDGVYRHPQRRAVFVGDLIDRGPQQRKVLDIARAMVEEGDALIVMGNHEFNAVSYATPDPNSPGRYLRPHTDKNRKQHQAFIDQIKKDPDLDARTIQWFKTLPMWLELDGLRVVHACWNDSAIGDMRQSVATGEAMTTEFLISANKKDTPEYRAIGVLLKGPELSLERYGQPPFCDKDGHCRMEARIRWWDEQATTLRELAEIPPQATTADGSPYPELPNIPCPDERGYSYLDVTPVVYGHYWRQWEPEPRQDWTPTTACVDFSAAKGGPLVAYRWSGETEISDENYVAFPAVQQPDTDPR